MRTLFSVLLLMAAALGQSQARTAGYQTFYYDINSSQVQSREKLVISEKGPYTDYRWFRADGSESYFVRYTNKIEIVEARISSSNVTNGDLRLRFDRNAGKLTLEGLINAELFAPTNAILDKTVFYIFTRVFPESNQVVFFPMVQPNDVRIVDMYLKWDGLEKVEANGKVYETVKYEFAVANPFAGIFWPYKYYYWYSLDKRRLIKHTGVEPNLSNETILLYEK
jgi:hypothetical protein